MSDQEKLESREELSEQANQLAEKRQRTQGVKIRPRTWVVKLAWGTSRFSRGLMPGVLGRSGSLNSFRVRAMVILGCTHQHTVTFSLVYMLYLVIKYVSIFHNRNSKNCNAMMLQR